MNKSLLIGSALVVAALSSCSTARTVGSDELSGEWNVTKIEGNTVSIAADQPTPYLAFDVVNGRMFGSTGCNRVMGGIYAGEKGQLDFSGIIGTRMMCPDMSLEDSLLTAINQVKLFGINKEGQLVLMDGQHRQMVTLDKRTDEISPASLVGSWKVNMLGDMDLSVNVEGEYTVTFTADGTFNMTTGCNNVGGNYAGRYVDLTFSQLRSTRMMCPTMEVEQAASRLLPTVVSFSQLADEGSMGFYDADNNMVMAISRIE